MGELWASVIAVAGTLLGGGFTYVLQERSTRRRDDAVRDNEIRRELRGLCAAFLGELTVMRQHQFTRFALRQADAPEADQAAARQGTLDARSAVTQALAALQLCTADPHVLRMADQAAAAAFTLHDATGQDDMDHRAAQARTAHAAFVEAARPLVNA